ncbi:predicted protein [Arabidopsis lyrata subsp. lyrata]|uniref:Predicted protein n=1 Tax=Arabidopsis lyrata subsp. lyrata TaxID=81972 RepID=D7MIA7_ARALL|nr:predicted protein [Arabidopsis lyrata subsp. lyrata]
MAEAAEPMTDNVEMPLFCYINTCLVSSISKLRSIIQHIDFRLGQLHVTDPRFPRYRVSVKRVVCRDFMPFDKHVKNILRNVLGFQDHRQPKPIYHVPDFLLEVHPLKYILENRRTRFRNIMVISSDYDFFYTTKNLMNGDYRVFLARFETSDPEFDDYVD